jgi:dihydroorotate dehydrogenase (NAD+) catalytic subunit
MLNSIGLQNPGVEFFMENDLPWLKKFDTKIIVNACGSSIEEYVELAKVLNTLDIDGVELNLSCPNVKAGCMAFGTSYEGVKEVTSQVKKVLDKPLIVKLTPNVTDITLPAKGAEDAGADGVSLINTLLGMSIDIEKRRPILANNMGGLSGPAVKPVAVRMVYQVAQAVKIPILGLRRNSRRKRCYRIHDCRSNSHINRNRQFYRTRNKYKSNKRSRRVFRKTPNRRYKRANSEVSK